MTSSAKNISNFTARKGFTLTEVLIVIVIVAVLAVVGINLASRAREAANSAKCASNLRQIASGMQLYVADKGRYPDATRYQEGMLWFFQALPPYLEDSSKVGKGISKEYSLSNRGFFYCPSSVRRHPTANGGKTYSMNESLTLAPQHVVDQPSSTMMIMDGYLSGNYWQHPCNWGNKFPQPAHGSEGSPTKVNVVFCDGHVASLIADPKVSPKQATTSGGYVPNTSAAYPFWRPAANAPNLGYYPPKN